MDTLELQRLILAEDLLPAEKLIGMALAFHLDRKTETIRISQAKLAGETGFSVRSVKRAIHGLVEAGIFESKRTRGAAILIPCVHVDKYSGMDGPPMAPLRGHRRPIKSKKMPWDYDLLLSTKAEEEAKRQEEQLKRDIEHVFTSSS